MHTYLCNSTDAIHGAIASRKLRNQVLNAGQASREDFPKALLKHLGKFGIVFFIQRRWMGQR